MADISTHALCVTCRQPLPEETTEISYFAQNATRPEAEEAENFLAELGDLTAYLEVLFIMLSNVDKFALDEHQLYRAHGLGWALAAEARHRVELADEAGERRQKRRAEEAKG